MTDLYKLLDALGEAGVAVRNWDKGGASWKSGSEPFMILALGIQTELSRIADALEELVEQGMSRL